MTGGEGAGAPLCSMMRSRDDGDANERANLGRAGVDAAAARGPGVERMRVPRVRVFFDIDGTLLLTDGAGRVALRTAMEAVYGTSGRLDGYHFHGKTDPQIVMELMTGAGLELDEVRSRLPDVFAAYVERLELELDARRGSGRIYLLPGVLELLDALERRDDVVLGLLTGNLEEGARLKLAAAKVRWVFDVGAYGSDAAERNEIARIAVDRCRSRWGEGAPGAVVVVGDTPEDVACARAVGGFAVAVATGRHGFAELEEAGADAVFADLGDTRAVVERILSFADASTRGEVGGGYRR